jgi:cyclopropane fatty-acyl-phospholipid synthase-like methyltransferase
MVDDMSELSSHFWEVFFDVYEALPRQGPGNRDSAAKALALCPGLPPSPSILDMGCGVGGQTIYLASLTTGTIVAIDQRVPFIEKLSRTVAERGLSNRIRPLVGDMRQPAFPHESFDIIWSEGALYNIGIENALRVCRPLLRQGGHLAFTDAVWRKEDPPAEVRAIFDSDYPTMGQAADIVATIERCGFELLGHFAIPDQAWWDTFYTPMQERVQLLRGKYTGDDEALALLDKIGGETEIHRKYSAYYAYEFFVSRRADISRSPPARRSG